MNNDATLQPILWWPDIGERSEVEEPVKKVSSFELGGYISIFSREIATILPYIIRINKFGRISFIIRIFPFLFFFISLSYVSFDTTLFRFISNFLVR